MTDVRQSNIFKSLKYHLNELKRLRPNYEFLMIAVQGSQNYNLDLDNEEYKSDIDSVAIVIPSIDSIINNERISETLILENNEHVDIKDLRLINELFLKENIKYLEILFTKFKIVNPSYRDLVSKLIGMNEILAQYDIHQLAKTTYGMAKEKEKAMEHPYEGLKDKIEKYGYDCKQLHHIVRLYYFLKTYNEDYNTFEYSINSDNYLSTVKQLLIDIKLNKFDLNLAREICKEYIDKIGILKNNILDNIENTSEFYKQNTYNDLKELEKEVFNRYLYLKYQPEEQNSTFKELLLPSIDNIWVTSDLHFGHENSLSFEPSRYELLGTNLQREILKLAKEKGIKNKDLKYLSDEEWTDLEYEANHLNIKRYDDELIKRWNEKITEKDLVFILGDFCFGNGKYANEILKQLKGKKVLIKGNHDNIFMDKNFDSSLFEEIVDYKEIRINKHHFILFHYPIQVWNKIQKGSIHLYGHIHSNDTTKHKMKYEIPNSYNVGVDVNNYYPVCIKTYIKDI